MKRGRTSLLIKFSGSTSVAALVLTLTCGSPGVVLAEVDVLTPAAQNGVSAEGTLQTPKIEGELSDSIGPIEGPSMPAASPAVIFDAVPNMRSMENAQREAVSIAEDQTGGLPQSPHEPLAAISDHKQAFSTDAAEESEQTNPVGVNMTSPENADLPTASIAESEAPTVQHSPGDPLASGTSQITESETLVSSPIVPQSRQEPFAAISNDGPSSLTDASEESGQINPVGVNMTSPENADLPTASTAESKGPNIQQSPEDPLASGTSQITESETLASPPITEIAGASNANIAEDQTPSVPQSRQAPLPAISSDEPAFLTDAAEESGQTNLVGVNITLPENAQLQTASVAKSTGPHNQQSPEDPLAPGTSQITENDTPASSSNTEIAGASDYEPSAQTADPPQGSDDNAEPLARTMVRHHSAEAAP
jgi:hypothetical protein